MTKNAAAVPAINAIAFLGHRRIAEGPIADVAAILRRREPAPSDPPLLVFDARTSAPIDLDLRGTEAAVRARLAPPRAPEPARRPGRPRLGVVPKEVTLLARHWDWLNQQSGSASATLRRLIDAERQRDDGPAVRRRAREATYRLMSHLAGDLPGFEAATRALFGDDAAAFRAEVAAWPADLASQLHTLARDAFADPTAA